MHTNCSKIALLFNFAFELHSNCSRLALELHSVCSGFALFQHWIICAFFVSLSLHSFSICFTIIYNFPRPIIYCTLFAFLLQSLLHCTLFALVVHSFPTLHYLCILCCTQFEFVFNMFYKIFSFPPGPLSIALFLHYLLHSTCIRIAFELHSSCTLFTLVLHSLVNSPGAIIDCTICQLSCTCVFALWSVPPGPTCTALCLHSCLHSVCNRFAFSYYIGLFVHSNWLRIAFELCRIAFFSNVALELQPNCIRIALELHSS